MLQAQHSQPRLPRHQQPMNVISRTARKALLAPLRRAIVAPAAAVPRDEQLGSELVGVQGPGTDRRQQRQEQEYEQLRDEPHPVVPESAPRDMTLTAAQAEEHAAEHDEGEDEPPAPEGGGGTPGPMLPDNDPAHPPIPTPTSSLTSGLPGAAMMPLAAQPAVPKPLLMTNSQTRRTLSRPVDGGFLPVAGVYVTTILTSVGVVVASMGGSPPPPAHTPQHSSGGALHWQWGLGALPVASMVGSLSSDAAHPLSVQASLRAAVGAAAARAATEQQHVQLPAAPPVALEDPADVAPVLGLKRPLVKPGPGLMNKTPELLPPAKPPLEEKLGPGYVIPKEPALPGEAEGEGKGCEGEGCGKAGPKKGRHIVPAQPIPTSPESLNAPQVCCDERDSQYSLLPPPPAAARVYQGYEA